MRVSLGVPVGRNIDLYNPELFDEHEEVIIFMREEFSRTYGSIMENMEFINLRNMVLDRSEMWKLGGSWPEIMEHVHIIGLNMKDFLDEKPVQSYLDAYLYGTSESMAAELVESASKLTGKSIGMSWSK